MEFSKKSLEEFKKAFREDYGMEFSDKEAKEAARNLVGFFKILFEMRAEADVKETGKGKREIQGKVRVRALKRR